MRGTRSAVNDLFIANDRDKTRTDEVGWDAGDTEACCTTE
jgi:hypothetical protein